MKLRLKFLFSLLHTDCPFLLQPILFPVSYALKKSSSTGSWNNPFEFCLFCHMFRLQPVGRTNDIIVLIKHHTRGLSAVHNFSLCTAIILWLFSGIENAFCTNFEVCMWLWLVVVYDMQIIVFVNIVASTKE